jgi:hypothetical protein
MSLMNDRKRLHEIVDPRLDGQYSMKDLTQLAAIATMCVQSQADYRPLMRDVVQSLLPLVKKSVRPTSGSQSGGAANSRKTEVGFLSLDGFVGCAFLLARECDTSSVLRSGASYVTGYVLLYLVKATLSKFGVETKGDRRGSSCI